MKKKSSILGLLLLLIPSVLANGEPSLWQSYDWYIIGAGLVLLVYVLFKITKKLLILGLIIALAVIAGKVLVDGIGTTPEIGVVGDVHYHADFKLYLNGAPYDFAQDKYMSTENQSLSNFAHFHDLNGKVIHKHASGITLRFFLDTLEIKLSETCLVLDDGTSYCNQDDKELKVYVNGKHNDKFTEYDIQDEDKILVSFGNESEQEIQAQIDSVSEEACIYSLKCPEKGTPPEEATCVGETCTVEG